ncbi:MAG: hypothetical protein II517_03745 [Ruminococcus sp.]|nr:hypothetical protein [Ruminococcus sp.]
MIRINNVKIPLDYDRETLLKAAAKELRVEPKAIRSVSLFRRSVDARKKEQLHFICTLDAEVAVNENALLKKAKNAVRAAPYRYNIPQWRGGAQPVVVGFGPAGMFAALVLAQSGACPIVVERGKDVDSRTADVDRFWLTGKLDTTSNVQFGEGGAGTFSDGKLNTGTKDSRQRKVLDEFVAHGAPEEILYNTKPHIGTDKLKLTVRQIREEIISRGGKVLFETKLTGFEQKDDRVCAAIVEHNGKTERIETDSLLLAVGHSARDTFEMLCNKGLPMEAKPFSVGARIEHLREEIDRAQYGKFAGHPALGAASYKMNVHTKNGRGAYTFCMCPGGKVVNASSEEGRLCTNGMSEFARNATNSNAALLVRFLLRISAATVRLTACITNAAWKKRRIGSAAAITRPCSVWRIFCRTEKAAAWVRSRPPLRRTVCCAICASFCPIMSARAWRRRSRRWADGSAALTTATPC